MERKVDEKIKNIKIYVNNKSISIQKKLFTLGAKWNSGTNIEDYGEKFLFVDENGIITWSDCIHTYITNTKREVLAEEILNWNTNAYNFKSYDKVLVRTCDATEWNLSFFGYKSKDVFVTIEGAWWPQCIPFEGNEYLLGTNNNPQK